jgi:hypothetical protein
MKSDYKNLQVIMGQEAGAGLLTHFFSYLFYAINLPLGKPWNDGMVGKWNIWYEKRMVSSF